MSISLRERGVRAVLLDIEGTTTPIAFVHERLFPYARKHLREFLHDYLPTLAGREWAGALNREWSADQARGEAVSLWPPASPGPYRHAIEGPVATYVEWLMDRDRKSPSLKALQGLIWDRGYRAGELESDVYADVRPAFEAWTSAGIEVGIYSSGSVRAQKLLFGATPVGDLRPYLRAYFDTGMGSKRDAGSYRAIAEALHRDPREILFVSDVIDELDAARAAGFQVVLSVRPGNPPQRVTTPVESIVSLDELTAGPVAG